MTRFLLLPLLLSCKDKAADTGAEAAAYTPTLACPGAAECPDNDGALAVGVAARTITPTCWETWDDTNGDTLWDDDSEAFYDCGCDHLCDGDDGWPGADAGEADGAFQAVWMAGFDNSKPMQGVHDDLWARAIVFDQGSTRVALVEVDLVGFFRPDLLLVRDAVAAAGLDLDHVVVAATHVHEGPDTMGLWGPTESVSGVDPDYVATVRETIVAAIGEAVAGLTPVGAMRVGQVDVSTYSDKGVYNILTDLRDPIVIDERMQTLSFWDQAGAPIATLVHFGDHPEATADENLYLTSDFAYMLREVVEQGVSWDAYSREGVGGTAIFVNGAVGGMMTGLRVEVDDPDGNTWSGYTLERTVVMGKVMGEMALDAVAGASDVADPDLSFAVQTMRLPVENWGFQTMFLSGIIDRELFDYDTSKPIDDSNVPSIETEIDVIDLGPLRLLTIPGELFPELNIGGYDGSHVGSSTAVVVDPGNVNPPDLGAAPVGPYIDERLASEHRWVVGLANDELGYVVPAYDFLLHETNPWFDEPEGDHYEETNSLGPQTATLLDAEIDRLVGWVEANQGR